MSDNIFHCALVSDWLAARDTGQYTMSSRGRTLDQEGFVHASYAHQILGVLQRFYQAEHADLCLLTIDPTLVGVEVTAEGTSGADELFPHIYGAVPVTAVVAVTAVLRDGEGEWWVGEAFDPDGEPTG